MRTLPVLLVLALVAAGAVHAARQVSSVSTLKMEGVTVPVKFYSGLTGTTTVGANRTYAETSVENAWLLISATSLIDLEASLSATQETHIRLASATGLPRISWATVSLSGTDQVWIENGVVRQSKGLSVPILAGTSVTAGGELEIEKGQNAALTLEVVSKNTRGSQLVETWVLRLKG